MYVLGVKSQITNYKGIGIGNRIYLKDGAFYDRLLRALCDVVTLNSRGSIVGIHILCYNVVTM